MKLIFVLSMILAAAASAFGQYDDSWPARSKAGDTIATVSARNNADPVAVAKFNGLLPNTKLPNGKMIKIPVKAIAGSMAESVDLTDGHLCGVDRKFVTSATLTGTVVKRQFASDELHLNGIVIRDRKDERQFVNIDDEYLADQTGMLTGNLSTVLLVGKHVRVSADVCGRIYVMRRVKSLRM